ncbi:MAG TPA: diguanylate cyclase, partial [Motilibacteraceae bacterium]|nr:diguanylate cyclase [Motilibacteraceae bacterium]
MTRGTRGTRGDGPGRRPGPRLRPQLGPELGVELLWLAAYAAAVLLGRATRWDGLPFTLVWPAAGVGALAWAAVSRHGRSAARFGAGLVLVTVALNLLTGVPAAMALVFGAANLVQPLVFCRVLGERGTARPVRAEDLLVIARASLAGALASAALMVPGAVLLQHGSAGLSLLHWVVRNGASMFVLVALAAAVTTGARPELRVPLRERVAVDVAVLISCLPVALVAQPAAWLPGPLLVWSALRRPTRVVAGQVALVGASFVVLTWLGIGPFGALAPLAKMLFAQAYVVVVVFVALALALVRDARALLLEEVAEREQHFRLLAEHSGDAIGRVARDGTVLWTSPQTEAVFGWSAAELGEADRQDVIDPRDLPAVVAATERVFSGTVDVETIRFRVRQPEGTSVRWVESRLRPVRRGGAVVEMVTSARDVTSGVRREELLAAAYEDVDRARELLHGSVDAMREVFLVLAVVPGPAPSPGTRVLLANAAAVERFAVGDPVGHDLADLLPTARDEVADRVRRAAAGAGAQALRLDHERADGTWAGTEELMVTSVGQDRLIAVLRDVTGDEARLRQVSEDHELALHAATHDALTGLPNRSALRQRLAAALAACPPEEQVGVVFIDLDGFKEVNDRWGHAAGDVVLRAVGNRLSALVRPADTASRLAGDEFVLVLRHLPAQWDADQLLASVQSRLGQPVEVTWADERTEQTRRVLVRPAASMGVVTAGAGADLDVEALLAAADSRMYEDKRRRAGAAGQTVSDGLSERVRDGLPERALEPLPGHPLALVPAPRVTLDVEGDRLTGLPERAAVVAAARAALARGDVAVALLLCDVDAFHQVNATYGGEVGDRVLARIAERMVRTASAAVSACQEATSAVVGRVGPDEFCVLLELPLPNARPADEIVSDVASEVLGAFTQPLEVDGLEVRVALTVGSSLLGDHRTGGRGADELFDRAHVAMRSAVRDGSPSARFDVGMHERARRRLTDEHLLRLAVEGDSRGGQLVNHYQPLVQPRTGAVVGVEALVRWQHPERGLVWPGEFVPLAEETGLVVGLTWQVLEAAAAQAARWRDAFGAHAPAVGLNVSGRCL